jgi:hypothetical protein
MPLSLLSCRVFVPPVDPVVADIPLALLGYGGLCFVFVVFRSFGFWQGDPTQ